MAVYVQGGQSEAFARTISSLPLHFVFTERDIPGSLIGDAAARGTNAIVIECGNHSSEHAINVAMHHIHATMKYFGMMREHEFPSYTPLAHSSSEKTIYQTIAPIKPHAGFHFINGDVSTGAFVRAGDVFAEDDEMEHVAPQDCYIVMPDKHPKPGDSDAGFLCEKTEIDR